MPETGAVAVRQRKPSDCVLRARFKIRNQRFELVRSYFLVKGVESLGSTAENGLPGEC